MPSLEITTMVGCPLMCSFCPQDQLKAAYGPSTAVGSKKYMGLDDFKAIIAKVPDYVRIDFSGMSEPWANPRCTDMLEHALKAGRSVAIYTTLSGMSAEDAERVLWLLNAFAEQVNIVVLHLPDESGNMRGWRDSEEYRSVLAMFMELKDQQTVPFWAMTMSGCGEVAPELRAIVGAALRDWKGLSRAGSLDLKEIGAQEIEVTPYYEQPVSCSFTPFYDQNVVLPNGDVVLCCMDYGKKHILGNLIHDDYWSLFGSNGMSKLRTENMKCGNEGTTICKSCTRASVHSLDAITRLNWVEHRP